MLCFVFDFPYQYKKPKSILEMERLVQQELGKLKAAKDGDVECAPS